MSDDELAKNFLLTPKVSMDKGTSSCEFLLGDTDMPFVSVPSAT